MRAVAAGLTDVGRERTHNEDRYIVVPELNLYVVADGMGGHQSGEVASKLAANTIASYFRNGDAARSRRTLHDRLRSAVATANAKIYARADDERAYRGMGTTVVAAVFSPIESMLHVAHAGDSRCYMVRGGRITQLTRDHSLVADALLERPDLTESDLAYLPRNVITRALGMGPTVDVDMRSERVEVGDVFLLCSDGLHGLVADDELIEIVRRTQDLEGACARLVERANTHGGRDNITAVLIRIEDGDDPVRRARPRTRQ
jgi:protein phosphatase